MLAAHAHTTPFALQTDAQPNTSNINLVLHTHSKAEIVTSKHTERKAVAKGPKRNSSNRNNDHILDKDLAKGIRSNAPCPTQSNLISKPECRSFYQWHFSLLWVVTIETSDFFRAARTLCRGMYIPASRIINPAMMMNPTICDDERNQEWAARL